MYLSQIELEVMRKSQALSTGGINLFWQYWSAPEGAAAEQAREDLIHVPPEQLNPPIQPGQFIPLKPFKWAAEIAHGSELDVIIIGGVGCGKTLNMVMIAGYYCCMMPNFRFLGTAPIAYQSDLSYKEFLQQVLDYSNNSAPRRILRWIESVKLRPYPTITFVNGSTMEFKSADRDANGILTWSGDMISVDQAESPELDLETVVGVLGSRTRGIVNGRPRLGKLILMANSAYNPQLWEIYDRYEHNDGQKALLLTSYDNPTLGVRQLETMARRFTNADEARRLMMSERPLPKGKEFTEKMIEMSQCSELTEIMNKAIEDKLPDYVVERVRNIGITRWTMPPNRERLYIMAADPGSGNPPYRNSPVVMVFDVTGLPERPATLAAFDWIYGNGTYVPFITRMQMLYEMYNPIVAAFDATGTQKAFDDLGVLDQGKSWMPISMGGLKAHMVLCAKVLMGRGMLKMPKDIYSIWSQLLMWCEPDKQLQQDIASAVFIASYAINQLLPRKIAGDNETDFDPNIMSRVERRGGRIRQGGLRSMR